MCALGILDTLFARRLRSGPSTLPLAGGMARIFTGESLFYTWFTNNAEEPQKLAVRGRRGKRRVHNAICTTGYLCYTSRGAPQNTCRC